MGNKKTAISVRCRSCNQLFCVIHRYSDDHECGADLAENKYYDEDVYDDIDTLQLSEHQSDNAVVDDMKYNQNIEVMDTSKFNELRNFGYNDKEIYNAWYYLKYEIPTLHPKDSIFINKMIDILSQQQMEYNQVYDEDEKTPQPSSYKMVNGQNRNIHNKIDVETECIALHSDIGIFAKHKSKEKKMEKFIKLIVSTNM